MGTQYGYSLDYLSQVLSQRGPQAVPYAESVKWNIREHLTELQKVFPSLGVKLSDFHSNDGRLLHLFKAEGTIPIHFQGVKYNIPIEIWLLDKYPYQAPWVLVVPTQNMVVKQGHPYVDRNGTVGTPYIHNWLFPRSNLVELTLELSHVFGNDPPLYSQPSNYSQPPPPRPGYPPQSYAGGYAQPVPDPAASASGAYGQTSAVNSWGSQQGYGGYAGPVPTSSAAPHSGGWAQPAYPPPTITPYGAYPNTSTPSGGYQTPPQPQQPVVKKQDLEKTFRDTAVVSLETQVTTVLEKYNKVAADEMEDLLEAQRVLTEREKEITQQVLAFQQERMGCEGSVAELGNKTSELTKWLELNEQKVLAPGEELKATEAVMPGDALSKQGLEALALDLALEDAVVVLDRALQTGVIQMDVYLKQIRSLSRRQFFARALALKVQAALRQPSTAPAPPRPPPQPDAGGWTSSAMLSNPLATR